MRVRTVALFAVDSIVEAAIEFEGRRIPVRASVIWVEPPNFDIGSLGEIGLQLADVSEDYLRLAAELFADAGADEPD